MVRMTRLFASRLRRRLLLAVALVLLLAWVAPVLVAVTGLRHVAARYVLSGLRGSVRVGRASLGWFRPVVLENVEIRDREDRLLLTVPRLESQRSLLALLPADSSPLLIQPRPDGRILLFTLALTVLTALVFGLLPAFRASRPDPWTKHPRASVTS